jgi:hypothetical protein
MERTYVVFWEEIILFHNAKIKHRKVLFKKINDFIIASPSRTKVNRHLS